MWLFIFFLFENWHCIVFIFCSSHKETNVRSLYHFYWIHITQSIKCYNKCPSGVFFLSKQIIPSIHTTHCALTVHCNIPSISTSTPCHIATEATPHKKYTNPTNTPFHNYWCSIISYVLIVWVIYIIGQHMNLAKVESSPVFHIHLLHSDKFVWPA